MEQQGGEPKGKLAVIKTERRRREDTGKPPRLAEIYVALADMVNAHPVSQLPRLPQRFYTVELSAGVRQIVTPHADGSLRFAPDSELVNALLEHGNGPLAGKPAFTLTHAQAVECVKTWRGLTPPLDSVPYTRWASDAGFCWRRVPFDLVDDTALTGTATWNRLLSKIESPAAVRALSAWIGGLFEPRAYRQQYVWIYGPGGNGKGCIARFLHRVFGGTSHFISSIPREPNQFWTAQFVRRRLIVVPDCDKHAFPASGLFKTLTGDDPVTIERKHQDPYTAMLDAMFLFTSNEMPTLSSEKADMRRAILVRMEGNGSWEADFEDKLWAEGGAFLWHCRRTYREMCPDFGPIPTDDTELRSWVSTLEEEESLLFEKWFAVDADASVAPKDLDAILKSELARPAQRLAFRKWLERTHGVRKRPKRVSGSVVDRYVGLRITRQEMAYPLRGPHDVGGYS